MARAPGGRGKRAPQAPCGVRAAEGARRAIDDARRTAECARRAIDDARRAAEAEELEGILVRKLERIIERYEGKREKSEISY